MSKKSTAGKIIVFGVFAGLVTVLVAMWKASKPIDDPWEHAPKVAEVQEPIQSREATVEEIRDLVTED